MLYTRSSTGSADAPGGQVFSTQGRSSDEADATMRSTMCSTPPARTDSVRVTTKEGHYFEAQNKTKEIDSANAKILILTMRSIRRLRLMSGERRRWRRLCLARHGKNKNMIAKLHALVSRRNGSLTWKRDLKKFSPCILGNEADGGRRWIRCEGKEIPAPCPKRG